MSTAVFYDHVIPPPAPSTGERGRKHSFVFDQLGPRVPAIVVSPLIPRNLIDHRPYDHTAIPATLRRLFKISALGDRDGISGGVDHLAGLAVRTDTPVKLPEVAAPAAASKPLLMSAKIAPRRPQASLADDPHGNIAALIHSAAVEHLEVTPPEQHAAIRVRVSQLRTHADAFEYLKEVEHLVDAARAKARAASSSAALSHRSTHPEIRAKGLE